MQTTGAELQNLLNEVSKALRLCGNGAAVFNLFNLPFCSRCCPELYIRTKSVLCEPLIKDFFFNLGGHLCCT